MTAYELIRAHYDASARGDLEGMLAPLGPQSTWTEAEGFPCAGTYVGPDAVKENVFVRIGREWDGYGFALEDLIDGGDRVVGTGTYTGIYKATGKPMRARVAHVWTVAGGVVATFEQFVDTVPVARAMEA
jgi:ketosteroid isomerase-like protein